MSSQQLIDILDEQATLDFTGRVNVLSDKDNQYRGCLFLKEGQLVHSVFENYLGSKAIYMLLVEEVENNSLKFIIEPEILEGVPKTISWSDNEVKDVFQAFIHQYEDCKKNKPDPQAKVVLWTEKLKQIDYLTSEEFDVLCSISDFNRIGDIIANNSLLEHEVISSLISLKDKGILSFEP